MRKRHADKGARPRVDETLAAASADLQRIPRLRNAPTWNVLSAMKLIERRPLGSKPGDFDHASANHVTSITLLGDARATNHSNGNDAAQNLSERQSCSSLNRRIPNDEH
jgi:hypothetical protein